MAPGPWKFERNQKTKKTTETKEIHDIYYKRKDNREMEVLSKSNDTNNNGTTTNTKSENFFELTRIPPNKSIDLEYKPIDLSPVSKDSRNSESSGYFEDIKNNQKLGYSTLKREASSIVSNYTETTGSSKNSPSKDSTFSDAKCGYHTGEDCEWQQKLSEPELLKVTEKNIVPPSKMKAEFRTVGTISKMVPHINSVSLAVKNWPIECQNHIANSSNRETMSSTIVPDLDDEKSKRMHHLKLKWNSFFQDGGTSTRNSLIHNQNFSEKKITPSSTEAPLSSMSNNNVNAGDNIETQELKLGTAFQDDSLPMTPYSAAIESLEEEIRLLEYTPNISSSNKVINSSPPGGIHTNVEDFEKLNQVLVASKQGRRKSKPPFPDDPRFETPKSQRVKAHNELTKAPSEAKSINTTAASLKNVEREDVTSTFHTCEENVFPATKSSSFRNNNDPFVTALDFQTPKSGKPVSYKKFSSLSQRGKQTLPISTEDSNCSESNTTLNTLEAAAHSSLASDDCSKNSKKNDFFVTALDFRTPKSSRLMPNLESTRKSSLFDLAQKTASPLYLESTVSSSTTYQNLPGSNNEKISTSPAESIPSTITVSNSLQSPENVQTLRTTPKTNQNLPESMQKPQPVESIISSITMPHSSLSPDTLLKVKNSSKDCTLHSTMPYDIERFLEDALGDELYNSTVTYSPTGPRDKSVSQYNASELISEERTPILGRFRKMAKKPVTEPLAQRGGPFDKTMTIYRSLTQRINKKLRPGLKSTSVSPSPPRVSPENHSDNTSIRALLQEVDIQQTLMYQASKALNFCRAMKGFTSSIEQVESERWLLVASLRKEATLEEIKKLNNGGITNDLSCEKGEVTLKDFSIALKEDVLRYEREVGGLVQWFVIIVSQGLTIWATHATSCPINTSRLSLPGCVSIANLNPGFKITVQVYSMKLRSVSSSHVDKYRLNKDEKYTRCPSTIRLWKRAEKPVLPKLIRDDSFPLVRNTSFVLSGEVDLHLHDLTLTSPWPMVSVPTGSVLQGTIDLSLSCKLHLTVSHSGFLTHGDEVGGFAVWNRRWCVLRGHTLMFWNYPQDQENKESLFTISLTDCVSKKVTVVDRTLCARSRTILIETARNRSEFDRDSTVMECRLACTIVRNLLSCDTIQDVTEWTSKLNHVISALREWNVTTGRPQPQVSVL